MPSASKPESKASAEVTDPIKQVLVIVEKKVRNLEKRKIKLDGYRQKNAGGEELNADQKEAISRYDGVVQSLELARELQKQFAGITVESEKVVRKQLKREKVERQTSECRRVKELLQLQNMLDGLGSETARADFISGTNGAVVLKEEELDKLDELYQLISPTREENTSYDEQLNEASEHIQNYIDIKEKEVAGTTYKALRDLVTRIEECSYFDSVTAAQPETTDAEEAEEDPTPEVVEQTEFTEVEVSHDSHTSPEADHVLTQETQPDIVEDVHPSMPVTHETEQSPLTEEPKGDMLEGTEAGFDDSSFFSTVASNRPRQFKEIVSSVQGTFDFLQESQIDIDNAKRAQQAGYQGSSLINEAVDQSLSHFGAPQHLAQSPLTMQDPAVLADSSQHKQQYNDVLLASQAANDSMVSQQIDSYSPEHFGQTHMNLQGSTHSFNEQASKLAAQMTSIDQSGVMPSVDGPQPIPMPNETMPGQSLTVQGFTDTQGQGDQLSPDSQEKKPFSMNPNADIFRSMYPQQAMSMTQQQQLHAAGQMAAAGGGQAMPSAHDSKFYSQSMQQSSDYQGGTSGGVSYVRGGGPRRGGGQGRGGRGGPGNNFPRTGTNNRGGVAPFNMPRGGASGNYPNNRGNSRGGGVAFQQGYGQRNDARPDAFQSYSNGGPPANKFSNRGGNGATRGPNVRGNDGVIRTGGPPRGARGSNGTPNRGYGRPNSGGVAPQAAPQAAQQA